jgi:hypothetical protein
MTPVSVKVGECRCPGTPHTEDEVLLAPVLTVPMGAAAMAVLNDVETTIGAMQAALTQIYLSPAPAGGILAWSFVTEVIDDEGTPQARPVPVTSQNIEEYIPWTKGGEAVARKADELYAGDLFRPLAERLSKSSEPPSTVESTSPRIATGSNTPKSSRSSSHNGTAGMRSVAPVR